MHKRAEGKQPPYDYINDIAPDQQGESEEAA